MKHIILKFIPFIDRLILPFLYPSAWLLKSIRRLGIQKFPLCKSALLNIGVFPIQNHYYEPQFCYLNTESRPSQSRLLPGIDWNKSFQLQMLDIFNNSHELLEALQGKFTMAGFYFGNGSFESGDAEYWYQLIRAVKPKRIIEVGSGNSTLLAVQAIKKNFQQDAGYTCEHICIEPYEMPWLEDLEVSALRRKIEEVEVSFFERLGEGDILFIDSSHIIRPHGDVTFEYLQLLPTLKKGVIVHIHDIFSPNNYPKQWLQDQVRFWNEQYLLEAFLTHNHDWKIIGALNYLHHNHYDQLKRISPFLHPEREPGSFYIQKVT